MVTKDSIKFYIIVPVFNMESYLTRCVESVIGQTYENWSLILVDDGSQDRSGEMIDQYALSDSRIYTIHKSNGGIASAMKMALTNIDGDYVIFIDGDDYIENNMLSILAKTIHEAKADIIQFSMRQVNENGLQIGIIKSENEDIYGSKNVLKEYFERIRMPSIAMRTFRKELFYKIEVSGRNIGVDETTIIQLFGKCNHLMCIDIPLYNIFIREGSVSRSTITEEIVDQYFKQYDFMEKYIKQNFINLNEYIELKYLKTVLSLGTQILESPFENQIALNLIDKKYKELFRNLRHSKVFIKEHMHFKIGAYMYRINPKLYSIIKKHRREL